MVVVRARFDGREYPVSGSPAADTIAYTRINSHSISGTGKKNSAIALRERATVAPESSILVLIYSIYSGAQEVANGIAVFDKDAGSANARTSWLKYNDSEVGGDPMNSTADPLRALGIHSGDYFNAREQD